MLSWYGYYFLFIRNYFSPIKFQAAHPYFSGAASLEGELAQFLELL